MKILLDTSVLVAAMVEAHPAHERALPWLQKIKAKTDVGFVAAHSIAELYAILSILPVQPRISSVSANQLIQQNVLDICSIVSLSVQDYARIIKHLSESNIVGGVTYDAVILYTAFKFEIDRIVTLNKNDFFRIYPDIADKIVLP
ncbi:MAG: PIN domain-containing protein [Candidatus Aminicenantes bacterium]|nr:PIN domain-containing protein [Candidatus Aminicenantes bacterium]NIM79379.1 PIN domain-containing protein [Candidatus Aminicenantes bacterium]NIN18656.1 PIN domain-containing protein [Candidatus Aminicenantes bacterium]NIN42545.1 PIN domain-containing protein [Candidatus Aminicenantes bacterium]NIN85311.1 PIN domain-containing protein [Candidatus Aminicenantes bacterium]